MTTTKTKRYYAMPWTIDAVHANTGKRYAAYYSFPSSASRDAWVENGAPYRGEGYREALSASDSMLRAELRMDALDEIPGLRVCHLA